MLTRFILAMLLFVVVPTVVAAFTIEADEAEADSRDRHPSNYR
jgi:hypothetical protein